MFRVALEVQAKFGIGVHTPPVQEFGELMIRSIDNRNPTLVLPYGCWHPVVYFSVLKCVLICASI